MWTSELDWLNQSSYQTQLALGKAPIATADLKIPDGFRVANRGRQHKRLTIHKTPCSALDGLKPSRLSDAIGLSDAEATFAAPDFYARPCAEIFEWSERGERHARYSREGSG
jgi:hypothetical protein